MKFPKSIKVYGDIKYRGPCSPESAEQITLFNQLSPKHRAIALHPRNEGKRTPGQVMRHKAEGMTTGAADIIIIGSPPFVCELKRMDHTKSKISPEQIDFLNNCQDAGAFVCIALGWKGVVDAIADWEKA